MMNKRHSNQTLKKGEMNLVQNLYDAFFSSRINSDAPTTEEKNTLPLKKEIPPHTKVPFSHELKMLVERYGEFETLEVELQELLTVLPRRRARVDSYNMLVKWLEKQNIVLKIKSRKTH